MDEPKPWSRQLLALGRRHRGHTPIPADAGAWPVGPVIRWVHRTPACAALRHVGSRMFRE
jgi:hypothetical protein